VSSNDPEKYAGGSVATGSHPCRAGQVMSEAERDTLILQLGGKGVGCQLHLRYENLIVDMPNDERQTDTEKYGHQ